VRCKYCNQVFQVQDPADIRSTTAQVPSAEGPVSIQSEHERLYVAHNLLQADHERLKGECTELRENLDRVTAELEAIRAALGTIAPHEVGTLADERESLAAEVHQLRDEIHALLSVQSERDQLAAERQRWDADLTLARSECENVTSQLRDRDNQLAWARAEYERLKADSSDETEAHAEPSRTVVPMPAGENSDFAAELEELRAQFAEVNERLEHAEHLNHEMGAMLQGMGIRWQPSWA
jgi:chromosome segregation ATPase